MFHGAYLNFLERARTEWLRSIGFAQTDLATQYGVLFIVRTLEVAYMKPAMLDDLVSVSSEISRLGRAQISLKQEVRRGADALVRAAVNLACVGRADLRPRPLPGTIHAALEAEAQRATFEEA